MSLRVVLAAVVLAASLAGAVWLHSGYEAESFTTECDAGPLGTVPCTRERKAEWQDPAAIALAVMGIGVAGAILVPLSRSR